MFQYSHPNVVLHLRWATLSSEETVISMSIVKVSACGVKRHQKQKAITRKGKHRVLPWPRIGGSARDLGL